MSNPRSTPQPSFGVQLAELAARRGGRLCVGIDPHPGLLRDWGLADDVAGLQEFSERCATAFADSVALVKPQVAFYERFGSAGFEVLENTIAQLKEGGALVVADAKRGDIGSTMAGYASAWLADESPLCCDAVTVSPYLGVGALQPVLDLAEEKSRGVFILAATSNPEAIELQSQGDKGSIAQQVVDQVAKLNARHGGGVGNIGVVVGATLAKPPRLDALAGPVLMPGVGAQGAGAEDIARIGRGVENYCFPNVSRAILTAGPDPQKLYDAARRFAEQFPMA